jgi:hypothetical protein
VSVVAEVSASPVSTVLSSSASMKKVIYGIKNGAENRELKSEVFRKHGSRVFRAKSKR